MVLWPSFIQAEPWLGTRFAQNCAGCHAPGRKNLPPVLRRCSLSCQGCHVNPNGGGLRSFYGKWNENRWLRSGRLRSIGQKAKPAPIHRQLYAGVDKKLKTSADRKRVAEKGLPLVNTEQEDVNELLYDRYHDYFYKINALSKTEFELNIPDDDPYREMDRTRIDGGGDMRLFAFKHGKGNDKKVHPFLMEAGIGLRYRPLRHTHFVYETRYFGPPVGQQLDTIPGEEQTRSLYVMQDDLPWNIFAMGGYYRPLFGNYHPDHTALAQVMTSLALSGQGNIARVQYKAASVGTAPNVPFANFHYINKRVGTSPNHDESGIAGNIGLRFVTMGAQVNYSFWQTTDRSEPDNVGRLEMHAFEMRGAIYDYILGIEAIAFQKDKALEDFREGGVVSAEGRYRFWRENYATIEAATANTARDLSRGLSRQLKLGTKHFLYPGLEVQSQLSIDEETRKPTTLNPNEVKFSQNTWSLNLHLYF